jgi:radical SAM superfamily enzyme YgiQ (UPF0313 family)
MKIQLVHNRVTTKAMKNNRDALVFPSGLLSIASYVLHHNPQAHLEIINGDFVSDIEARLDGDLVGFMPNVLNVDSKLWKILQARGQKIIVGGVHASQAPNSFLNLGVDYVNIGDGEEAILSLSQGVDVSQIPSISTKEKTGVFSRVPLKSLPLPRWDLLDADRYATSSAKFTEKYLPSRPFRRMANIYSNKGCIWRAIDRGCDFCGRMYKEVDYKTPQQVWQEVSHLVRHHGIDYIWDTSDSFTSDVQWLKEFVEAQPDGIMPYWMVFGRAAELSEEVCELLQQLNVYQVFVGVESADDDILQTMDKGSSYELAIEVAKRLKKYSIKMLPGLIVGSAGETEESAEKTYKLAKRIVEINATEEISMAMMVPMPGSRVYRKLCEQHRQYYGVDLDPFADMEYLQREWVKYNCEIDFDTAVGYIFKVLSLVPLKNTFAVPRLLIDPRMPGGWSQLSGESRYNLIDEDS